ncbi:zinc-dependent alcohol dehydrogenase [Flexilinea flocculi]|jgi:threonine dehydrogenase-like Zn-dependent dehydrogenase|uniref:Threonine dehydrogenase n=1 Tax=Flexilinea flocculi TaxID=1678840 RepID=A0A0S7BT35_9CHLR|nr:alcohol dehydrogenase catalytic domain-containing protein [Flexilinea flocculi]NMB93074.1 alcohol dehydrogenase catalytic domain-containing protein [Flexilinea flocculi]GAP40657.1 threonine dehydrogenase [Flexilinea flocculi]
MRALKFVDIKTFEIQDEPIPVLKEGEVLLKIHACGICGSDVEGYLGKTGRRIPVMTMGHEFSAEIISRGPGANRFQIGDSVIVQPINFCGTCENCQKGLTNMCLNKHFFGVLSDNGAMAEYLAVPEKLLYKLPDSCNYYDGALTEPYAVAYGSVKKAGNLEGKDVLIIGAGMIGLCILQNVKLQNPNRIFMADLNNKRLERALTLGASDVINTATGDSIEKIRALTNGKMIDFSFEAVGIEPTANLSIKSLKIGGSAVWVGMCQKEMVINMQDIVCSARNIIGSFNYTHEEFGEVVNLMSTGKLATDALISEIVSLADAPDAFNRLHDHPESLMKIIIDPTIS